MAIRRGVLAKSLVVGVSIAVFILGYATTFLLMVVLGPS